MKLNPFIYFIFTFLIAFIALHAQAPRGEIANYDVLNNQDTVFSRIQYGDWWLGAFGGVGFNNYIGEASINYFSNNPIAAPQIRDYQGGSGSGYFFGFIGEYIRKDERLGYSLRLSIFDRYDLSSNPAIDDGVIEYNYEFSGIFDYVSVSPSVRYNFMEEGFHTFGGVDLSIPIGYDATHFKTFENSGDISEEKKLIINDRNVRFGFHVGLGYDILMSELDRKYRTSFTPYASLSYLSSKFNDYESTFSGVNLKLGLAVRFNRTKRVYDTLEFDPYYEEPPIYLASANDEGGVESIAIAYETPQFSAAQIAFVETAEVIEDIAMVDTTQITTDEDIALDTRESAIRQQETVPAINIDFNNPVNFSFRTTTSTQLTDEMRNYLDAVFEKALEDPNSEVRIVGHSDDRGTLIQNTERSTARAQNARRYLISKGLDPNKVLATGIGAIEPIAPNTTEQGRRRNRRIVIEVVK